MATAGFGQKQARRKKWITGVVVTALSVTALTVGVTYWVGVTRKEQPLPITKNLPADIHQQLSGYTFTRSEKGRQVFTVHAARTVAFKQGGATVLEDVMVEMFGQAGNRHDILRTRQCDYNPQTGDLFSSGTVQIELNAPGKAPPDGRLRGGQPVYLETSKVAFRNEGSTVVSDAPLRFRIGPASGTARGMTYGTRQGWLELESDVALELQPRGGADPPPPVRLQGSRLRYDKSNAQVRLWGPLEITQGTRRATAEQGMVYLDPQNRITRADLEGMVQGNDSGEGRRVSISAQQVEGDFDPATNQLTRLLAVDGVEGSSEGKESHAHFTGQRLELSFSGAHPEPLKGDVSGPAELTVESPPASPAGNRAPSPPAPGAGQEGSQVEKKTLTAAEIKFTFRPEGRSVQEAETVGAGKLVVVPSDPNVGERVITAGQLTMAFDTRSRLEALRGLAPTHIVFQPPAHAVPGSTAQESSADWLEARFDTSTQLLRDVQQSGHFQFQDGDREGRSDEAHYVAPTQSLSLTGHPVIWDSRSRMKSRRININLRDDTAEGLGDVQATQMQDPRAGESGGDAQPTHILAERMVAKRSSQFVHYEGNVRAWHGSDVVETSALDVYRSERRLSSGLQVLTSHLQQASPASGPATPAVSTGQEAKPVTVRIRADRLEYLDEGRKAGYRGQVRMQTESTTLEADRLDVYFSQDSTGEEAEIERALAEGHVIVDQPGRHATGEHADYFAEPGKIVLTGGPPTLEDAEKGSTTGQRLTFFIHDDRLFVDGGEKSPSISKHRVAQ